MFVKQTCDWMIADRNSITDWDNVGDRSAQQLKTS